MRISAAGLRVTVGASMLALAAGGGIATGAPGPQDIGLPDLLVEAVARDLRLDAGGYLARAELAQRLAEFESTARFAYPDVFAGVRMEEGRAVVALAEGVNRSHAGNAVAAQGFTAEDVSYSAAALIERRRAVERWVAAQPAQVAATIIGDSIDIAANTVVLRSTGEVKLPAELGPVRVEVIPPVLQRGVGTAAQEVISAGDPDGDMIGGNPIAIPFDENLEGRCSLAFNGTDGTGNTVALTAGHCAPDAHDPARTDATPVRVHDVRNGSSGPAFGEFTVVNNDLRDFAIIRIHADHAARFQNNRVSTVQPDAQSTSEPAGAGLPATGSQEATTDEQVSGSAPVQQAQPGTLTAAADSEPLLIDGVATPVVGAPVCKSGAMTGFTCGTITEIDQTYYSRKSDDPGDLERLEGFFGFSTCGIHGDSGGSVTTGTKALGIVSGSGNADVCDPQAGLTAQPIATVIAENQGLQIRTS
ncbi:hypothetical protein H0264_32635 [Nocardia huaxiensis]|uniref:Trypsin n=1 Tax=Nocardia huaxiensis TaxID=2755382 RepID=A0A7D6ZGM6_9NOCA|nr:S1 family peptidase [Nocardia huaxiensis]QLY29907.1 hypothetical protein H0264_32635 [Nocardia huaxiensis]